MSSKLAVIAVLAVLACAVNAMPQGNNGGGSNQNNNNGGGWHEHHHEHHHEPHHKPHYKYEYSVKDHHTGDEKSAHEQHDGHKVTGGYSLKEADGSYRHVSYVADHNGFHAQVHRTPGHHPQVHNHGWQSGQGQ